MIEAGTILIEKSAARPGCFELAADSESRSWVAIAGELSARDREKALTADGWTFSYLAGAIRATAVGFTPADRMASALTRLTAQAAAQQCNCMEIDEVAAHSFLGVPYVSISAHSRDIQKSAPPPHGN